MECNTPMSLKFSHNEIDELLPANQQPSGFIVATSAPGKIILFGEHSVVYGKLALAASLGLRTKLKLVEFINNYNGPNIVKINLQALNIVHSYDLNSVLSLLDKPLPLVKSPGNFNLEKPDLIDHAGLLELVGKFIAENSGTHQLDLYQKLALTSFFYLFVGIFGSLNIRIKPFVLSVTTELTISAGMGSSGSYLVTVAAAFFQYIRRKSREHPGNFSKPDYKPLGVAAHDLEVFSKKDLELISKWAQNAENIIHGSASGIDNTICTFGSMVEFYKGAAPKMHSLRHKFKVLLVNTMVPRETKRLVMKVAGSRERFPAIINHVLSAMNEVAKEALECLSKINKYGVEHEITSELQHNYRILGELSEFNHNLLGVLQVSHPKLEEVCARMKQAGLLGKLTGAGGGGYAMAIVPPDYDDKALTTLVNDLNKRNFQAIVTCIGGAGVTVDLHN